MTCKQCMFFFACYWNLFTLHLMHMYIYRVVSKLVKENNPVTLALDGWTNVNHNKVTNLILLSGGRAYYWKSIVNSLEHNTAGTRFFWRFNIDDSVENEENNKSESAKCNSLKRVHSTIENDNEIAALLSDSLVTSTTTTKSGRQVRPRF